jgi:hypothetical protein
VSGCQPSTQRTSPSPLPQAHPSRKAGLSGSESVAAVAVFVVIASATVAGPVVFYLLATDRAVGPLASLEEFMSRHNAVIMMVVLLILGAKLLGQGLGGVAN